VSRLLLIIDDDPVEREILERVLLLAGYRVATAPDGQAGLEAARSAQPDLVLLDVMMPHLNGYQTCRALRSEPATAGCPILMLTAKDETTDRFWASEVGADAFLTKPADVPLLLQTIADLTGRA
jgi:twitching motility two-component system response regulator PilH